jgi:hypothetical protein
VIPFHRHVFGGKAALLLLRRFSTSTSGSFTLLIGLFVWLLACPFAVGGTPFGQIIRHMKTSYIVNLQATCHLELKLRAIIDQAAGLACTSEKCWCPIQLKLIPSLRVLTEGACISW